MEIHINIQKILEIPTSRGLASRSSMIYCLLFLDIMTRKLPGFSINKK